MHRAASVSVAGMVVPLVVASPVFELVYGRNPRKSGELAALESVR